MADIALLVAEEFERRRNRMEKGYGKEAAEFNCAVASSSSSLLSRAAEELSSLREVGVKEMEELLRRVMMEPKTTLGVAAFDGFFSA